MPKLFQQLSRTTPNDGADRWLMAVPAIVADNDDPERQHRVRVIIPSIDEEMMFDDWARQLGCYTGGPGYGSFFLPPVGSEVVLFGQLGQKYNLFFLSVYNEEFVVPEDFADETAVGFRAPGDFKIITELDMQLRAGRMRIETDASLEIIAPGGIYFNGAKQ